jgi:shikimate dehydrogenase
MPYAEVIGDPISHSKSPLIHEYWLGRLGLEGSYRRCQVGSDGLAALLGQRRCDPDWRGCNVTIPHKEAVIDCIDQIDDDAGAIGAVNIVVPRNGKLVGSNSDVDGIATALGTVAIRDSSVLMIGAGGAARAAAVCLKAGGARRVTVLARDPKKADSLRTLLPQIDLEILPLTAPQPLGPAADLIINASPLGMTGCPDMPTQLLELLKQHAPHALFFDMVYSPLETQFIAVGRESGGRIVDGLAMLIGQAARAFSLFFGATAPEPDGELRDLLIR